MVVVPPQHSSPPAGMIGDSAGLPVVRSLVRAQLTRMFGRPPFDPSIDPGDPGLLGPRSASWRLIAEPAAIAGGIRGLFMQSAHPLAMAGVVHHSSYQDDPLGRLKRTSLYVTTTAYGSMAQMFAAVRAVRRVHRRVNGVTSDGRRYDANNPELLTWVSIALTDSFLDADRRWSPAPLSDEQADQFVAEQSWIAALLDPNVDLEALAHEPTVWPHLQDRSFSLPMINEGTLPVTVKQLRQRVLGFTPELRVDADGLAVVDFLRDPPLPLAAKAGYRRLQAGARAALDPQVREALHFTEPAPRRASMIATTGRLLNLLRLVSGTAPSRRLAYARCAPNTASPARDID